MSHSVLIWKCCFFGVCLCMVNFIQCRFYMVKCSFGITITLFDDVDCMRSLCSNCSWCYNYCVFYWIIVSDLDCISCNVTIFRGTIYPIFIYVCKHVYVSLWLLGCCYFAYTIFDWSIFIVWFAGCDSC
jgi:hypothetical protein